MPELPEVETILWERTLAEPSKEEFEARLVGQALEEIGRRGKYLLFQFTNDTLVMHLRMSGDVVVESDGDPIAKHHRLLLSFEGGLRLAFNDTRKFGRVWLMENPTPLLSRLGPEPLSDSFTAEQLHELLGSRRRQLKPLLLDQNFLAGLGNIYTDEALHRAGLHPLMISNSLTREQADRLWRSIREVLREGIRRNGASIDWVYRGGDFQNYFKVYRRTGEPCFRCGTLIARIVVGQRSTHYCPNCQAPQD